MNSRELERLNRRFLVPQLPGMAAKGTLVFANPIADLLRGLDFEPSGFQRDTRRIHYFVMPLYTPTSTHINYGFARVLGGANDGEGDRWFDFPASREPVMQEILAVVKRQAVPWLDRWRTPADLAARVDEFRRARNDPHVRAAVGYSHIMAGNNEDARSELQELIRQIEHGADRREWLFELGRNASTVLSDLEQDPRLALARLQRWRTDALNALGLRRFAAT